MGVFAEFERSMIVARVNAGLDTARAKGKKLGRPKTADRKTVAIRAALEAGGSVRKVAAAIGTSVGTVHRVKASMTEAAAA
jgi:DNA invertase Pin-like site-specific DNA recombinase